MAIEKNRFEQVAVPYQVSYGTDITIEGRTVTPPFQGSSRR